MKPGQVKVLIDKYDVLLKVHDITMNAVNRSKEDVKMILTIRGKKGGDAGASHFPLEFNLELGQALYQAQLDEYKTEMEEIKRRMNKWT